jgi:ABC-type phosphate/phosphonate transport system permease subunit
MDKSFALNEAGTALLAIAIVFISLDTLSAKIRKRIHFVGK